jgi:hypothetical protein
MNIRLLRLCLLALAVFLSACGSGNIGPERDANDPTNSLVFAYVDMDEAPTKVHGASLKPQGQEGYWQMGVIDHKDGQLLIQSYLPSGSYQLASLRGSGFFAGNNVYQFPTYGSNETAVRIQKPGIYFMGAYRYHKVKTGFFEGGKFDFERVNTPTELELLQRLQQEDWVKGTQWEARLRNRIAELRRK